jgi:hypothetical protein
MQAEGRLAIERMLGLGRVFRSSFYRFDVEATPGPDSDMDLRDAIQRIAVRCAITASGGSPPSYGVETRR